MSERIEARLIADAPFGIEVTLDPREPLPPAAAEELRDLYRQHHLLLMRGQEMSYEAQRRLVGYLDVLLEEAGKQYVSNTRPDGLLGSNELDWHTDIPFTEHPYRGIALHAVDIVDGQSSTRYVDTTKVYASLSDELRERIANVEVKLVYRLDADFAVPSLVRPLASPHPDTGEMMIVADALHSQEIIGLAPEESSELLAQLFAHQYAMEQIYEHWWSLNDLVVWDNRAVQHARGRLDPSRVGTRTLRRVTLGTHTVQQQIAEFTDLRDAYYPDSYYPKTAVG